VPRSVIVDPSNEIRILHVDDDVNQSEFLQYFLPNMDKAFRIDYVSDPCQVMEKMESEIYDCVVTDFQMPKINGIELAEKIRESFDIPIIIYTGQGSEEIAEAAFSAGIDDYLRKEMDPSHYQVLAKRIRNVVEKNRVDVLYKTVIEQTQDALIIFVDNKIVYANKPMFNLLGLSDISDFGDPFNFALSDDRERALARLKEVIENGHTPGYNKYRLRRKDGEVIHVSVSSSPVTYNGKQGVISFIRDITEMERLEEEKRESQERLRSLVELAPDGILTMDLKGVITSVNPAFGKITGYDPKEIKGNNFLRLKTIRREDLKTYFTVFSSVIRGNMPPPFEFRYTCQDGTMRWGEAHLGALKVGEKREILAILRDVTERKRSQPIATGISTDESARGEVDNNLLLSIGQLAYLIGNEIIFPIRNVRFLCEELQRDQAKISDYLPQMVNSVDQALLLLEGFLSRTDNTILKPTEKNLIDAVMFTINQSSLPDTFKIVTKHTGEISADFDECLMKEVFSKLIQKISIMVDGRGIMDLVVESGESQLKLKISNIIDESNNIQTKKVLQKLLSDPEIMLCGYDLEDNGGVLQVSEDASNPSLLLMLPVSSEARDEKDIPEFKELVEASNKD